jgi:hypothetical protein
VGLARGSRSDRALVSACLLAAVCYSVFPWYTRGYAGCAFGATCLTQYTFHGNHGWGWLYFGGLLSIACLFLARNCLGNLTKYLKRNVLIDQWLLDLVAGILMAVGVIGYGLGSVEWTRVAEAVGKSGSLEWGWYMSFYRLYLP